MSYHFGFMIESMVAILLLLTILYCVRLSKQLHLLRADEQSLRATIAELVTATEIAERAIAGLKSTMRDGEQTLGAQIISAESLTEELGRQIESGSTILAKLGRIAGVSQSAVAAKPAVAAKAAPDAKAVAAAAQAFAERTSTRAKGLAA